MFLSAGTSSLKDCLFFYLSIITTRMATVASVASNWWHIANLESFIIEKEGISRNTN